MPITGNSVRNFMYQQAILELLGRKDVSTAMIYMHILNKEELGVRTAQKLLDISLNLAITNCIREIYLGTTPQFLVAHRFYEKMVLKKSRNGTYSSGASFFLSVKFEGVTGGGTWTSYMIAPQQSYVEVEGEMEMP